MKVLIHLIALLALSNIVLADESLDRYISQNKKEQFSHDYEKNEAEVSKLRDSWISPFVLNYSFSKNQKDEETQDIKKWDQKSASINWNQTIFQSGGIYYGIKYATASGEYANYSIDVQKRKLVKDAISILMQIKQTGLRIKRQELQIKNAEISLEQKKEQYLNGLLDSGFLDNAIIERNLVIQALYDIETSKERLISRFEAISDMDYKEAFIPQLSLLSREEFLSDNIVLKMSESELEKNRYFKNVTITKYLPKVSFVAGYNWNASTQMMGFIPRNELTSYNYGIQASMPLDINTFADTSSSKMSYLKSKVAIEDRKRELNALYDQVIQNIKNYDKKKQLSVENKDIYDRLLLETEELFKAGQKTQYDVDLLKNSVEISQIDFKIYDIDKQLELLTLYEMYKKED